MKIVGLTKSCLGRAKLLTLFCLKRRISGKERSSERISEYSFRGSIIAFFRKFSLAENNQMYLTIVGNLCHNHLFILPRLIYPYCISTERYKNTTISSFSFFIFTKGIKIPGRAHSPSGHYG